MTLQALRSKLAAPAVRLSILILSLLLPAFAGTWTVFGPENFDRDWDGETRKFTVQQPDAIYTLRVENGGADHTYPRVTNASIVINGVEVLDREDFDTASLTLQKRVTLRSINYMTVKVYSPWNGVMRVSIVGVDNDLPSITASIQPSPNGAGWNKSLTVVGFTCTDPTSGIDACTSPVTLYSDTAGQTVVGTAIDKAGNKTTKSVLVKLDKTDPDISAAVSPQPNSRGWNNSDVTVTFTATDGLSGVASVSGPVALSAEGALLTARGTATDVAGNSDSKIVGLRIDKTAPLVTIASPQNNAEQWSPWLALKGTATDSLSGLSTVKCDGLPAYVSSGEFICLVKLDPGPNTVNVVATDAAGNSTTESRTVTYMIVTVSPGQVTLYAGQTQQFTANVPVTWTASVGSISSSGLYTAPAGVASQQSATITATSQADSTKKDTAIVTLLPAVTVTVAPATATLYAGQTQQFTANVPVTWTASVGSISASGLYTAPAGLAAQQSATVTATSQADSSKKATATVTLLPPITVSVTPATATLYGGQTQQFTANVAVTWVASVGTIGASGLYTAPANVAAQQSATITATSQVDNTKTGTATVTLLPPITVSVTPATATLYGGQTQQFTATVAVTWTTSVGTISASGLYTAPANVAAQQSATITATSQVDNTKTGTATVTLLPPITVSVTPATATLYGGQSQQFTATVANAANTAVTWTASLGSISATGLYTAPTGISLLQPATITATSQVDNSKTGTATVTLSSPISVSVTPATVTLYGGQSQQFTATVANAANTAVTWTASLGSISATGLYTAPTGISLLQPATITATSQVDNSKTGTATVTLLPPITVSVTPATATLYGGQSQQFTATVANAANTAVTWTASLGSISATGLYTAPTGISLLQPATITATSQADNSTTGTATVTLTPPISVSVTPATVTLYGGQSQQFTATVANAANTAVTWTASLGSISATGLYTAPTGISLLQPATITATSQADNSTTGTATVTLTPPISVSVTPATVTLYGGQSQQFTATVANTANTTVTWTAAAGTISPTGLYTAPASVSTQQSVTITATSQADNSAIGTATVTLSPPISVSVSPATAFLYGGQSQQFTAAVANAATTAVTWTASIGSISATGLYAAPASISTQQSVTITATSQADNTTTGIATVTLFPPISISVTPLTVTLYAGQTQQFATTVLNAVNTGVTWTATAGTISASGLYTAPPDIPVMQPVTITATSQVDNTTAGTATVTLSPAITVTVQPATGLIVSGQTQQFSATVANTPNTSVTWTASAGTISASGLFTSPANILTQQNVTITATSQADNTKSGSALFTVTPADSYLHRRSIKIDHTKVPNTDQANFPILVSGVYSYLAHISNNGHVLHPNGFDIAFFADASGTQRLDREIESYDPVTGAVSIWVRIPNLSHTCDTVIFMLYGNPAVAADQPNTAATWDAGFAAVYHMSKNGALSTQDSTQNANHCVNHGATSGASLLGGAGGGALALNGTSAFLDCGNAASLQISGPLTMSAWTNNSGNGRIVGKMDAARANGYEMFIAPFLIFNNFQQAAVGNNGTVGGFIGGGSIFTGSRLQLVSVFTPGQVRVYRDGGSLGGQSEGSVPGAIGNSAANLGIGYNPGISGDYFGGGIDEVRISSVARSADWVATEFNTINSPSSFYAVGLDNDAPPAGCLSPLLQQSSAVMSVAPAARPNPDPRRELAAGDGYRYRRTMVIDHRKVPNSDQVNFPVLIAGTFPYLATTANGGGVESAAGHDIIVSSDRAGAQKLDHELESYDPITGAIALWVRVPLVSHTFDTVLYLSYGNPTITNSQGNRARVWDGNYQAVLHLGESAAPYRDSTVNAAAGGTPAAPAVGPGKIGRGQTFNGTSEYIDFPGGQSPSPESALSIETWIKTTDAAAKGILGKWESDGAGKPNQSYQLFYRSGRPAALLNSTDATDVQVSGDAAIHDGVWHHVAVTAAADAIRIYVDGVLNAQSPNEHPMLHVTADRLLVGATRLGAGGYVRASLDEIRISDTVRSADWIAASFRNQSSPETFVTILPEVARQ